MTYEKLQDKVNKILTEAETAMENFIESFNETNDEDLEVNTTDLGYKFTELKERRIKRNKLLMELNKYSKTVTQDPTQPAAQAMLYGIGLNATQLAQPFIGIASKFMRWSKPDGE